MARFAMMLGMLAGLVGVGAGAAIVIIEMAGAHQPQAAGALYTHAQAIDGTVHYLTDGQSKVFELAIPLAVICLPLAFFLGVMVAMRQPANVRLTGRARALILRRILAILAAIGVCAVVALVGYLVLSASR
jgi:hypothetical protein